MNSDMDTRRVRFWSDRSRWPWNTLGKIFLGNAVHILGMQLYGSDWTETTINRLRAVPELPEFEVYEAAPSAFLGDLGVGQGREILAMDGQATLSDSREGEHLSREEWEALRDIFSRDSAQVRIGREMWTEAVATLTKGFLSGDIATYFQTSRGGGGWTPIVREQWAINDAVVHLERFVVCAFDPETPFEVTHDEQRQRLIFVDDAGLVRFREKVAAAFGQPVRGALIGVHGRPGPTDADLQEKPSADDLASREETRPRQSPKQQKVMPFLTVLFPTGIPDRSELTDAELVRRVASEMGEDSVPSDETILRAAGRKR